MSGEQAGLSGGLGQHGSIPASSVPKPEEARGGEAGPLLSVNLRPVREAIAQLGQMWAEMEQFVLRLLDGWSVILQRLALESEQAAALSKWTGEVADRLKALDHRMADLGASVRALEAELVSPPSRAQVAGTQSPRAGSAASSADLPPLILPIRPEPRGEEAGREDPSRGQPPVLPEENPGQLARNDRSPERWDSLMRKWNELVEKLDELLGEPPGI